MSSSLLSPESRPGFFRTTSSTSQISTRSSKSLSIVRSFSHQKNKMRLYLGMFSKGGSSGGAYSSQMSCDSYHWALIVGPKSPLRSEAGTAYHIVHSASDFVDTPFYYEETDLNSSPHQTRILLARITLAKVVDIDRLEELLRSKAVEIQKLAKRNSVVSTDSESLALVGTSCLSWVKSAWDAATSDGRKPLKSYFDGEAWEDIESRARRYVKRKRMQGRYSPNIEPGDVTWNPAEIPTWNYWENRETTD